ncbi:MAG: hypothetical protein KA243_01020 [Candidatus Aminicenantes bacterium]|nr:hypothetical protein [Candidatus Aminicenantes bacterium]
MHSKAAATILTMMAAVLALSTAGPAQDKKFDALLGTWDVKMEDGSREFVWEFTLKDGLLAGKYTGASGSSDMADLSFEGGTVKFTVTLGGGMVIRYEAAVAEDRLVGTLSLEYGEAAVTGTRRK